MKNILSKLIQKTGFQVSRLPGKSNNPSDEYYQIKRLLSTENKPIIFDVGAHAGEMAKRYRKIFPNAKIYSFEPILDCFNHLRELFKADNDLHVFPFAISDQPGEKEFFINQNLGSSSLLSSTSRGKNLWGNRALETHSQTKVQCQTLDQFCSENDIEHIHLLKLDIQGAELDALRGAERILESGMVDIIFTEISISQSYNNQGDFHQILSLLNEFNFELFNIYKAIRRNGRLMEIDVMFIRSGLLSGS